MKYKNNPLNIRYSNNSYWKGLIGSKNGFCEFSSIEYGLRAGLYLLLKTYKKRGWITLEQAISHWAPPFENNTTMYINYVLQKSGLNSSSFVYQLKFLDLFSLLKAMCFIESNYVLTLEVFTKAYFLLKK